MVWPGSSAGVVKGPSVHSCHHRELAYIEIFFVYFLGALLPGAVVAESHVPSPYGIIDFHPTILYKEWCGSASHYPNSPFLARYRALAFDATWFKLSCP